MKNKFLLPLLLLIAASAMLTGLQSFKNSGANATAALITEQDDNGTLNYAPPGTYYEYTWTKDTISNANNDTLYLPARLSPLLSDFQVCYSIIRTSISGTANIAVKVEESAYSSGTVTDWVSKATTAATTATAEHLVLSHVPGMRQRIVIDGTGTQSTSYVVRGVLKKLN